MKISKYMCPNSNDLEVQGNMFAETYSYFEISMKRCIEKDSKGNPCKSEEEINNAIDNTDFSLAMVNTYYDFDDYYSPVKDYLDDQIYFYFMHGFNKIVSVYIKENEVEQKDSIFRYSPDGEKLTFSCRMKI